MALSSTMYTFDVALSDIDRGAYETLAVKPPAIPRKPRNTW